MSVVLTNITGAAQTGLTSPVFNVTADNNPANNAKQWIVTTVGGTGGMTSVTPHSAADPFTLSFWKPLSYKVAQFVSTTVFKRPPRNLYRFTLRKGVTVNTNFPKEVAIVSMSIEVPAGAESLDPNNLRAMMSATIGALSQISSGFGDTIIQNSL